MLHPVHYFWVLQPIALSTHLFITCMINDDFHALFKSKLSNTYKNLKFLLSKQNTVSIAMVRTIGSIAPEEDPICPELLPVFFIYSPLQRVNYYLTDELLLKVRLSEGYENKGIIGYAAPGFGASDAFTRI
ncbi:hypothetical protein T11_9575 [Trichinella zimbabwensis]|uniref:Uncharacterized protein n=1 Tax=Trichinella zimbabwensis TaxID=268475 RepID=A0A0V1GVU6_9BILA|nr:hypothetical protein T11_9575 [Trichinella zimbabwensis]